MNPHNAHATSAKELIRTTWQHRSLISQMTVREVLGRYRGSLMGLAWSFFNPILLLVVYTVIFGVIFKSRWGGSEITDKGEFAIIIFAGMLVHGLFAECFTRAPGLIAGNPNYVKKVVFPLEVLPWISMGSALFHTVVSWAVLLVAQLALRHVMPWTVVFFPVVMFPLVLATMGFSWFLAATGVYLRDVAQVTGIITTVLMFLSPMFYPVSALPPQYQKLLYINPLTYVIESVRDVLIWGKQPHWGSWALYTAGSAVVAWIGFWWFQKTRKGFSDVL
ncbi:ABC polysaccharide/polyol phosphate export pump, inner membrane subunit [Caballeronia arvi]|uniref:Transport permease protein n=1 Tax=Caballeronia arvi TaxID=1777135 RepID=A0A158JC43_9BURK|nr:ABC polysaccharide/polyol phosphate export pump, inner membrane subunit [Caballeronia arvi]